MQKHVMTEAESSVMHSYTHASSESQPSIRLIGSFMNIPRPEVIPCWVVLYFREQ